MTQNRSVPSAAWRLTAGAFALVAGLAVAVPAQAQPGHDGGHDRGRGNGGESRGGNRGWDRQGGHRGPDYRGQVYRGPAYRGGEHWRGDGRGYGPGFGPPVIGGALLGLGLGALLGNGLAQPAPLYATPPGVYYPPGKPDIYAAPPPAYYGY